MVFLSGICFHFPPLLNAQSGSLADIIHNWKIDQPRPYMHQDAQLPADIEKVILEKTGTEAIYLVPEVYYRTLEKSQMLAFNVELLRKPTSRGELLLHARIVIITEYGLSSAKSRKYYHCETDIKNLLTLDEHDVLKCLSPF